MKKAGKILIGVLSVGALIGTGYAAWHINNGFVSTESGNVDVSVNDMIINSFAKVVVKETDTPKGITFDGGLNEDLHLSYKVTAEKTNSKDTKDPYDLSLYENVAKEYIPDLKVIVKAVKKEGSTPLTAEELANVNKYINLPEEQTFSYTDWLSNKEGKNIALDFSWSKATFNGQNPENYFKENPSETAETTIQDMINTLKPVTFKVHFDVGQHTFTEPDKSGTITIPEIANSTLTIDGKQETSITAGEHEISIALEEGKQIKDNKLTVIENGTRKDVTLNETRIRATGKVYTCTYTFLKDATYSFEYTVENIPPRQVTLTEGTHTHVNLTTTAGEAIDFTAKHDVGSTFEFKATALEGYKLESVKHNDTILEAKGDVYSFKVVDGTNTISATATEIPVVVEKFKVTLDTASSEGATLTTVEGTNLDLNAEYEKGTELKFKVKFDETQYKLTEVTNNGTKLTDTEGVYTITIGEKNSIKVTLEKVEAPVEECLTIKEVLAKPTATSVVTKGKIVAIGEKDALLYDGEEYISIFEPDHKFELNSIVKVTADTDIYNDAIQLKGNLSFEKIEDSTLSAVTLPEKGEKLDANYLKGQSDLKTLRGYFELSATSFTSGKYTNFRLTDDTENAYTISTTGNMVLEPNLEYTIKGFVTYVSGTRINVFVTNYEIKKGISNVEDKYELLVGGTLQLKAEAGPSIALTDKTVSYSLKGETDVISLSETGEIKALKTGEATVIITSNEDKDVKKEIVIIVNELNFSSIAKYDSKVSYEVMPNGTILAADFVGDVTTKFKNITTGNNDYISKVNASGKVYWGGEAEPALKLGTKSGIGTLTIELDNTKFDLKQLLIKASGWNTDDSKITIKINDQVVLNGESLKGKMNHDLVIDVNSSDVTKIEISNSKRVIIQSIDFLGTAK